MSPCLTPFGSSPKPGLATVFLMPSTHSVPVSSLPHKPCGWPCRLCSQAPSPLPAGRALPDSHDTAARKASPLSPPPPFIQPLLWLSADWSDLLGHPFQWPPSVIVGDCTVGEHFLFLAHFSTVGKHFLSRARELAFLATQSLLQPSNSAVPCTRAVRGAALFSGTWIRPLESLPSLPCSKS